MYTASCLFVGLWKLHTGIKQSEHTSVWFLSFSIQSIRFQILVQDWTARNLSRSSAHYPSPAALDLFCLLTSENLLARHRCIIIIEFQPSLSSVIQLHLWWSYESLLKTCIHETPLALARLIWAGYLWWLVSVQWLELLHILQALHYPTGTAFEAKSSFGLDIDSGLLNLRETVTIPWAALTT